MGEPCHIHVTGHGGTAKIWLEPIELVEAKGFNVTDMRRIMEVVKEHHRQFVEAWDEFAKSVS